MDQWNSKIASSLYQPLEGDLPIRLLLIHPGEPSQPLKTELVPTTLENAQGCYDATSYTWGSPETPELINCGDSQLWVQRNAFDMMLDLRRPDRPRRVWIDAVCINQCDLDERAAQVAMMHHIYRRAGATWVWLGRADEHSSVAMAYAATLNAETYVREFADSRYGSILARFVEKSYFFDPSFNAGLSDSQIRDLAIAIVNFLNRPWFSRVWIQQEVSLSENTQVACGPDAVAWDSIFALAWIMGPRYTETWPDYVHSQLDSIINVIVAVRGIQRARHYYFQDRYGKSSNVVGFGALVENVSRYEATDPRDRIYAMGNILADSKDWFDVDYRVPWEVLYTDVATRFLEANTLRFLKNAGRIRQKSDTALPSWVPDYSHKDDGSYMIPLPTLWKAGGVSSDPFIPPVRTSRSKVSPLPKGRRRRFPMSEDLKAFKGPKKSLLQSFASIRCLMSDRITYVGDWVDTEEGNVKTNVARMVEGIKRDVEHIDTLRTTAYFNGDTLLDAYRLTLIMSCDAQQEPIRSNYTRTHWDDWFNWYEQGCPGYWDANLKHPAMDPAFESSGAMKTFRFAVTEHGYFCLAPRITEIGDEVAILQSYELAVTLRRLPAPSQPQAETDPFFELLGDAYVHGMMENEARCITDEFNYKYEPSQAQWRKILEASDGGRGEPWATLGLSGQYERILKTLGARTIRLV
ncbi:hypothetical protein F4777DRAFT_589985 [Nemania sp. FL0916]|nr:hypothetical protein F4777DRAFT_589985 [Nemania sp. FL0916]